MTELMVFIVSGEKSPLGISIGTLRQSDWAIRSVFVSKDSHLKSSIGLFKELGFCLIGKSSVSLFVMFK